MSVNHISQSQARESEAVQNVNSQKSPTTATKANAVDGQDSRVHAEPATQTVPAATADNNAGREQGHQQNTGSAANGTHLNVFA